MQVGRGKSFAGAVWAPLGTCCGLDTFADPSWDDGARRWFCDHNGSGGGVGTVWVYKPDTRGQRGFNGGAAEGYPLRRNVVVWMKKGHGP